MYYQKMLERADSAARGARLLGLEQTDATIKRLRSRLEGFKDATPTQVPMKAALSLREAEIAIDTLRAETDKPDFRRNWSKIEDIHIGSDMVDCRFKSVLGLLMSVGGFVGLASDWGAMQQGLVIDSTKLACSLFVFSVGMFGLVLGQVSAWAIRFQKVADPKAIVSALKEIRSELGVL